MALPPADEAGVPAFLSKLYTILEEKESDSVVAWSQNGDTFVVYHPAQFASDVLPRFFKHSNFHSFVRQLNLYGFHKLKQAPTWFEFVHPKFKRDQPHLLKQIKRRVAVTAKARMRENNSDGESDGGKEGSNERIAQLERNQDILFRENHLLTREITQLKDDQQKSVQCIQSTLALLNRLINSPSYMSSLGGGGFNGSMYAQPDFSLGNPHAELSNIRAMMPNNNTSQPAPYFQPSQSPGPNSSQSLMHQHQQLLLHQQQLQQLQSQQMLSASLGMVGSFPPSQSQPSFAPPPPQQSLQQSRMQPPMQRPVLQSPPQAMVGNAAQPNGGAVSPSVGDMHNGDSENESGNGAYGAGDGLNDDLHIDDWINTSKNLLSDQAEQLKRIDDFEATLRAEGLSIEPSNLSQLMPTG